MTILDFTNDDRKYLKSLFQIYFQPLCQLSQHYLKDNDESKGVVQEAFVKLWEIRFKLNPDSNIPNFLFTLVKHACLNILKRRQVLLKHHEKIKLMEMHYQYESLARMGSDYLDFNELKEKIDIAIQHLPTHCRIVFEMSRYEDLKNCEIAEKLGVTQKTVEAHLTKALKILRNNLKEYLTITSIFTNFLC